MFYSQFILAKKGPLGTIWIAAHLERKLRKNQVADTDIGVSVDSILAPDVPIALRLSSHLLLGVVRIYSKKVHYLFDDCSDALLKVKQAFRSTAVDLPPEQSKAPYHSITLPETFDLDDFEIPDDELFQGNYVDHHVSAREQITLQDKLDGVAFSTSRFGPDERFGDGDASQIGLDLDEDMFLDKNEVAGTSGVLMDMDVEQPAPLEASSSVKDGGHNEIDIDPSLAASASNFSIQAPSTPGLVEEPNLPSAQAPASDDHMDEDHSPSEFAAKEVSGLSDRQDFPDFGNHDFHADGSCDQQDDEKVRSLGVEHSIETMETFATIETQPLVSDEHAEATVGPDSVGNVVNCNLAENESNVAADIPFEGHSNRVFTPLPNTASVMEVQNENIDENGVNSRMPETESENMPSFDSELPNIGKTDLHIVNSVSELQNDGEAHPNIENSETKSENIPPVDSEVPNLGEIDLNIINSTSECHYKGDPYQNIETSETFGTNMHRKLSAPTIPVLQNCSSLVQNASTEVDGMANTSNFLVEEDRLCSVDIPGKDDYINVSSISTDVQDSTTTNLGTDQPTDQVTDASKNHVDGNLHNKISVENIFEKENDCKTSDFPAIEKLLSMPNLPTDQHGDLFVESTPIQESTVDADKVVSGRKRSYTESTLTVQSLNSVESFGAAQYKQSGELIPEDDDLLSSILVGKRSTTLKMKPTPPVADTVSTKRRRVAMHSTALKRKVLVDDATVLHGDMIRQQLTSTEDIRRVRTKAPCTRLEIWMLRKQFLEDEIFTEPLFAGMSTDLLSLHYEAFDLERIKVFEDIKGTDKVVTPAKDTLEVETGNGTPLLGSEATGIDLASETDPVSEVNCNLEAGNTANSSHLNEIGDVGSVQIDASCQLDDERCEMNSIKEGTSATKDTCGAGNTSQEGVFTTEGLDFDYKSDAECLLEETGGVDKGETGAVHIGISCQLDDERCEINSIKEGTSATKDTCGADNTYQEGVLTTEGLDFDNKSDAECLLEEKSGVEKDESGADIQDNSSLSHDINVGVSFKDEAIEGCQLGDFVPKDNCSLPVYDDFLASDQRENGGAETPWNLVDGLELDSSFSVEADLRSQNTVIAERENPEGWDADPMMSVGPTAVQVDHIYSGDHADYGTEAVEHDTDFLNVDDDDVGEDYESEIPDADEKRILDNTGWSARTRAVANYLQVLFEKEDQHRKKNVSVDSLLAGKSRKEAARMFFETLVLKTKDYIQVEQESPCGDIRINPQCKLLKSEF